MSIYAGHSVQDHEQFLMKELLLNIVDYSGRTNTPPVVVVMAAFLSFATMLQGKGLGSEALMKAINAPAPKVGGSDRGAH